jgi:hypothetical protein
MGVGESAFGGRRTCRPWTLISTRWLRRSRRTRLLAPLCARIGGGGDTIFILRCVTKAVKSTRTCSSVSGRSMKAILSIVLVAMVLPGPFNAPVIAADKDRPFGESPPPGRSMEERPFGGPPPPKHRGLEPPLKAPRYGKKCRTHQQTCQLAKGELLGGKCTCPTDRTVQGKVVK